MRHGSGYLPQPGVSSAHPSLLMLYSCPQSVSMPGTYGPLVPTVSNGLSYMSFDVAVATLHITAGKLNSRYTDSDMTSFSCDHACHAVYHWGPGLLGSRALRTSSWGRRRGACSGWSRCSSHPSCTGMRQPVSMLHSFIFLNPVIHGCLDQS